MSYMVYIESSFSNLVLKDPLNNNFDIYVDFSYLSSTLITFFFIFSCISKSIMVLDSSEKSFK